ncbi:RebB family R body protein [Chromobacterium subtsugae]|uniref:RebB family R body protein n=1 Tax=Chromobacterium subtsugae TaxID=251747 RepID=UPI000640DDA3|nr:RebB family R body protein [Chromobacterium subtsugae]
MKDTAMNSQITDAVTQSNVKVVGEAPAMALGSLFQSMAHSTGLLYQNAVSNQQQQTALNMAAANQGVMQLYSVDSMAGASAAQKVSTAGSGDNIANLAGLMKLLSQE